MNEEKIPEENEIFNPYLILYDIETAVDTLLEIKFTFQ